MAERDVQTVTLKEYVCQMGGRMSMERTLKLLWPVIETLEKLHQEGIIHRNVCPDNITILPDGWAELIDYREAQNIDYECQVIPRLCNQGFDPLEEHLRKGKIGPWTDVHAMCATIYYCITDDVPPSAVERVLDESVLNLQLDVPMTVLQKVTLQQGLQFRQNLRIQSMTELKKGLYIGS